jgi:hypothetical protein
MKKIALIGLGNLGKHYMSGLSKIKFKKEFFFIDTSAKNLNSAKKIWLDICNKNFFLCHFGKKLNILPKNLDLVIIATTTNARLKIIKNLINSSKIRYWIVEKPIATDIDSLNKIYKYLKNQKVFINISRVYSKNYLYIKKKIETKKNLKLKVDGSCWNLASNAIHFIYIYFWLTNSFKKKKLSFILDVKLSYETKRKNFFDFYGSLKIKSNNNEIILLNNQPVKKNFKQSMMTEIVNGNKKWKIDELNNKLYHNRKLIYHDKNFYQSLITDKIITNLFRKNQTKLPSLSNVLFFQKKLVITFKKSFLFYNKVS